MLAPSGSLQVRRPKLVAVNAWVSFCAGLNAFLAFNGRSAVSVLSHLGSSFTPSLETAPQYVDEAVMLESYTGARFWSSA